MNQTWFKRERHIKVVSTDCQEISFFPNQDGQPFRQALSTSDGRIMENLWNISTGYVDKTVLLLTNKYRKMALKIKLNVCFFFHVEMQRIPDELNGTASGH